MFEELEELTKAKKKLQEKAHIILKNCLEHFFKKHPDIKAIGWTQYTPYFNDGEECVFNVNGLNATKSQKDLDDNVDLYDGGWAEVYTRYNDPKAAPGFTTEEWADLCKLSKTLEGMEDELKIGFGDHVKVIVTHDGVEVEEYEHD